MNIVQTSSDIIRDCDDNITFKPPKKGTDKSSVVAESTPNKAVNFTTAPACEDARREKYLTAKYGAHQMALIRKRLKVEMWMFDQLQILCKAEVELMMQNFKTSDLYFHFRQKLPMTLILIWTKFLI